jgi:hypothetical protein
VQHAALRGDRLTGLGLGSPLEDGDVVDVLGEDAGGDQAGHAAADHQRLGGVGVVIVDSSRTGGRRRVVVGRCR